MRWDAGLGRRGLPMRLERWGLIRRDIHHTGSMVVQTAVLNHARYTQGAPPAERTAAGVVAIASQGNESGGWQLRHRPSGSRCSILR